MINIDRFKYLQLNKVTHTNEFKHLVINPDMTFHSSTHARYIKGSRDTSLMFASDGESSKHGRKTIKYLYIVE